MTYHITGAGSEPVIPGQINAEAQRKFYERAYQACGIITDKITHVVRGTAARQAEKAGVDGDQINRHGGK